MTVTQTLPAGWCRSAQSGPAGSAAHRAGQQISCTNSTSPFTSGTITVNGVVTSSSVTQALVQSRHQRGGVLGRRQPGDVLKHSGGYGARGTGGHRRHPDQRRGRRVAATSQSTGRYQRGDGHRDRHGGGVRGRHADHAEPVRGLGAGCFTVSSGNSLDISWMPAHAAAAVTVRVVTLGISASTTYSYNAGPALLFLRRRAVRLAWPTAIS